jgi:hypothetical protein
VVFNIGGNKFRLVVRINYPYRVVYIRFVGTPEEYDETDAETKILSRKRALTLPMIRRLSKGLDLGADILIQEVRPASRRKASPKMRASRERKAG